jgi:Cft2 family RNA processing exonuclease
LPDLNYKIIATGSGGNAVKIENFLIDCGVSFKDIQEDLYDVKYLLITHSHQDHVKEGTLNKIKKKFPNIVIIGNKDVNEKFGVNILLSPSSDHLILNSFVVEAFHSPHNAPCNGYVLFNKDMYILYATDLYTTEYIPKQKYDYIFLEANYDKTIIEAIRNRSSYKKEYRYDVIDHAYLHLSKQDSKVFYYTHRRNSDSVYIPLHMSNRFY